MSMMLVLNIQQEKSFQDRIWAKIPEAFFEPCTAHGLNLLLEDRVTARLLMMILYETIQIVLYTVFCRSVQKETS